MDKNGERVTPSCGCIFCDLDLLPDDKGHHWVTDSEGKTKFKCPNFEANSPRPKADQQ